MRKLEYSKEDWEKIIDGTKTAKQVVKECQVNRQTVYHVSKKYSLPLLKDHLSYLEYHGVSAELIKKDLETMTVNDVAKKYELNSLCLKEWCYCTRIQDFLAGLKAGRPQWHDLEKDPTDLPKDKHNVWCKCLDECGEGWYDKDTNTWTLIYRGYHVHCIEAWCELPEYKEIK